MSNTLIEEIKVFQTEYNVFREKKNTNYYEYSITYKITVNSKTVNQNIYFASPINNSEDYDILNAIFNGKDFHKLQIVKTSQIISEAEISVSYNARISATDNNEVIVCYDFELGNGYQSSKSQFENFISLLKFKKIIE